MKSNELKQIAKDILLSQLGTAHYELENNLDLYCNEDLDMEEIYKIAEYINQYGNKMAKVINKTYKEIN